MFTKYFLIALGFCGMSYAQQEKDSIKIISLNEIIVTGKQNQTNITYKNDYQKRIVQPKNISDLFTDINGFSVVKRGNYAIDPVLRGFMYEQLNVMYDGGTKAVNACPNRMDPITTHVTPEEVSKIEVIKGPFTVRYGSTFAGIVNMVTENADTYTKGISGKVSSGYETNGNSYVGMAQLRYATTKYDITGSFGYRNFGDYKDGDGQEIPSSFKSTDYGVKLGYNLTENQRLQAHWRQSFGRDVKHAALPMDTEIDDSSILSLDYKAENLSNKLKTITAKGFYSYVDHLMTNANRPSAAMTYAAAPVTSTTYGGKFELHWLLQPKINLYVGADANLIGRDGERTRTIKIMNGSVLPTPRIMVDKIWQDAYLNDYGVFTEMKYDLSSSTLLSAGVRLDFVNTNAKDPEADFEARYNVTEKNETNFSGAVSLKNKLSDHVSLELAFGRGTRTADMLERYINHFSIGQDAYEYLGNPNLKPEVNNQFEVGLKGYTYLNQTQWIFSTSVFYSIFENYIMGVVDENIPRKFMPGTNPLYTKVFQNIDDAYKTGAEFSSKFSFANDLFFQTDVAYTYSWNNNFNESLPLTPPLMAKISGGIEKDNYWASVFWNLASKQTNISESFGETETPGYGTLDIKGGLKLIKNLDLGIACLNVLDQYYVNHLNFPFRNQAGFGITPITEPGRNFTVFVQYHF